MIRPAAAVAALALLILAASVTVAAAVVPEGPRLAYTKFSPSPSKIELLTAGPTGDSPMKVAGGGLTSRPLPYPFDVPTWSPDGSQIVFSAYTGRLNAETPRKALFVASADGSGAHEIPGTVGALHPVFSPDGHTVAFARERIRKRPNGQGGEKTVYESASIWLADLVAGGARRITPWRNRLVQIPSSFAPDGSNLAITRSVAEKTPEAIGLYFDGSASAVLARNAIEPVYSPDGSRMAFLRGPRRTVKQRGGAVTAIFTDIYVANTNGGGLLRLTKTSHAVEVAPQWDPSSQRLAYTELNPLGSDEAFLGFDDSLMEINADGTCRIEVLSFRRAVLFGASWQPGPGRGAGPISC
jgi:Tol biopolymer transport system component